MVPMTTLEPWLLWTTLWFQWLASLVAQVVKHLPAMQETWVQSLGWEDPLEKEMAAHSSTLAWKIPWREEPGRLQSMRLQRVGHDWATSLTTSAIFSSVQSLNRVQFFVTPWIAMATSCKELIILDILNLIIFHARSCPTLCNPLGCNPPGSSVHGISQARILEWVAISSSRGSS